LKFNVIGPAVEPLGASHKLTSPGFPIDFPVVVDPTAVHPDAIKATVKDPQGKPIPLPAVIKDLPNPNEKNIRFVPPASGPYY